MERVDELQEQIDELQGQVARLFHTVQRQAESLQKLHDERGRTWYKIVEERGGTPEHPGMTTYAIEAWRNGKLLGTSGAWTTCEYARERCTRYLTGMDIHPAVGSFRVDMP